ncbi:MAG: hypothetical protein KDC73_00300 [Ignavibacteriae bacterium]|nr:hypothetical protein [Ignavibacteriota bacterium]MCB9242958.1 hypothetical protein [Ignavibacteriales bacterium]
MKKAISLVFVIAVIFTAVVFLDNSEATSKPQGRYNTWVQVDASTCPDYTVWIVPADESSGPEMMDLAGTCLFGYYIDPADTNEYIVYICAGAVHGESVVKHTAEGGDSYTVITLESGSCPYGE